MRNLKVSLETALAGSADGVQSEEMSGVERRLGFCRRVRCCTGKEKDDPLDPAVAASGSEVVPNLGATRVKVGNLEREAREMLVRLEGLVRPCDWWASYLKVYTRLFN